MLTKFLRAAAGNSGTPAVVTYVTNVSSVANGSSYTFSNTNIGGAGLIVVAIHGGQGGSTSWTVSSCTIGGVSATIHVNPSAPDTCAIASAVITSGSTATISFSVAGATLQRAVVGVYRITDYQSATPVATASQNITTGDTRTVTLNTSNNGVVIAGTSHSDNRSFTWTNATENYDVVLSETSNSFSAASSTTTGGDRTITVQATGIAGDGYVLSAVSWR